MFAGLCLFSGYALLKKGMNLKHLVKIYISGILSVKLILLTYLIIGIMTALWRSSGCLPAIVSYVSLLIQPSVFILLTFLINCLVSFLTGTAMGTAATTGVICMSIAGTIGASMFWTGGAILAGSYFGDRCSPVSTSALLTAAVTNTDLYGNLKAMAKSAFIPALLSCLVYLAAGLGGTGIASGIDAASMFRQEFQISPLCLLPAAAVLVLACCRVRVQRAMLASIAASVIIALTVQQQAPAQLLHAAIFGFSAGHADLSAMVDGGGMLSLWKPFCIVSISACCSGIFRETGLISALSTFVSRLSGKLGSFRTICLLSIPVSMVSCSQSLSIIMMEQLTETMPIANKERALDIEDTAAVLSALIPWSVAGSVPLVMVGAPISCMAAACYLYILPLWRFLRSGKK